jgi:hypothetical protein
VEVVHEFKVLDVLEDEVSHGFGLRLGEGVRSSIDFGADERLIIEVGVSASSLLLSAKSKPVVTVEVDTNRVSISTFMHTTIGRVLVLPLPLSTASIAHHVLDSLEPIDVEGGDDVDGLSFEEVDSLKVVVN